VTDGTFTIAMVTDPGSLDPQASIVAGIFELNGYAYDSIVGMTPTGVPVPQLAKSWTYEGLTAVFTLNEGITCSDGSPMTAQTVADNLDWIGDFDNASPYLDVFLPVGLTVTADDDANTVTLELAGPQPFLLESLANVPIVCSAGLADRSALTRATIGSGPYELTEAVPSDHYTYERRDGYTWGPNASTTDTVGLPKTIEVRVVPNESTAVNMLLAGEVSLVVTTGPDAERAKAAGLSSIDVPANLGFTWYNQALGHPTAYPAVRKALTQALNFDDLAAVITGNTGSRATSLAVIPPASCSYDSVTGNIAAYDPEAAAATLEEAGFVKDEDGMFALDGQPLTIEFLYDSVLDTTGQAAAELAIDQWTKVGFTIVTRSLPSAQMSDVLFGSGDWDVVWEPINVNSPDQIVGFFSGPSPAEGGVNLGSTDNAAYVAAVEAAMEKTGLQACTGFQEAEAELLKANDFVLWAVRPNQIFLSKVEYEYVGRTQVTSLRMLAS